MPIYTIREDVERFRNIDYRAGNRASHSPKDTTPVSRTDKEEYNKKYFKNRDGRNKHNAYASGNMFESLAKTNPELFNKTKLEALTHSQDLVKDFNEYMASVYSNDIKRFGRFVKSIEYEHDNDKIRNKFQMQFNISLHSALYSRYMDLIEKYNMSEEDAARVVTQEYFPESLNEQGIRDCLNARIANNRCLTDSLTAMLKQNYALFDLSKAEAESLINDLDDDDKNHEATAKIRDFLRDPKLLQKFKSGNNYDFRPIGGAVLFLSENDDIQFCEHPSKNLSLIFKYDAIVNAHGSTSKDAYGEPSDNASYTARSIKYDIELIEKFSTYVLNFLKELSNKIPGSADLPYTKELISVCNSLKNANSMEDYKLHELKTRARELLVEIYNKYKLTEYGRNEFKKRLVECDKIYNVIGSRKDPKKAMKDGAASNWTMEPISTLTKSNLVKAVDIVRALKEEGFKNVFIGSCNPGGWTLPKDLTQDKNFKVTYGSQSVLKEYFGDSIDDLVALENYIDEYLYKTNSPYRFYSLNELYEEYDLLCNIYPMNEGIVWDKLKEFFNKASQIVAEIWKRIIEFFKKLALKIAELIKNTFGVNSDKKIEKPVEVTTIQMDGDRATIRTTTCNTPEEIQREVEKSNKSIQYAIQKYAKEEIEYIKEYRRILERNDNIFNQTRKNESYGIFDNLILI